MHNENVKANSLGNPRKPILSLILCSRNDQYMGNSLWRLETTLNYVAKNVGELCREEDVEVIVVDWGSEVPLHTVLKLSPIGARIVSFVIVPPALAREVQKDSPFSEVHALNAAARRANGEYIGRIDQDILVGKYFLKTFFEMYGGARLLDVSLDSVLLFANRRRIPYRFAARCPPFQDVDRCVALFGQLMRVENLYRPHLFYFSMVGICLLHRNLWYECGGYDERLIYMNRMESDMLTRLMKRYRMVNLGKLVNHDFYHLEHYDPRAVRCPSTFRKVNPDVNYVRDPPQELHPNGEDWGLIQHPLEVVHYSSNLGEVETVSPDGSQFESLVPLLLMTSAGVEIAWDRLIHPMNVTLNSFFQFYFKWRRRARVAWEAVRDQPLINWPQLLRKLWVEKKSTGIRQQKN